MKELLAVSWELPPMYGPRGAQVWRSLNALGERGWRSTVISMAPRRGAPHWRDGRGAEPPAGTQVLRVPSPEEWTVLRALWRIAPALRQLPDAQRVWVGGAVRSARRAASATPFTGLLTFAQPWSDHLVGLRVHRETGLPWVAHFSDPWVDNPYARAAAWQVARWQRMETNVIREATAVVFVTEETADLVMRKYPAGLRAKAFVVPHGFQPIAVPSATERRPGPLRLVHTGRFYAGVRTPSALLQALALLHRREPLDGAIALTFAGPHGSPFAEEAARLGISALATFQGRMTREDAEALAQDADALLVIDAPSVGPSVFLPSKLVDYLPMRKPILGLTPAQGASATLLRRLGGVVAPPDDVEAIAAAIADLIRDWRAGVLRAGPAFDAVSREYDIRETTAALDAVLTRAFERRAS